MTRYFQLSPQTKKILVILLWVALLGYAWHIRAVFEPLASLTVSTLAILILLILVQLLLQISLLPLLLKPLGIRLPLREWLPLGIISTTGNMIVPAQGGTVARSLYLKQRHGVSYSHSAAIISYQFVIRSMTYLAIAVVSMIVIATLHYPEHLPAVLAGVSVIILFILCGALIYPKLRHGLLPSRLQTLFAAWKTLRRNYYVLFSAVMINLSILILNTITFGILLQEFGTAIPPVILLGYTTAKFITLMFSILPGNMGVSELLTGGLTMLMSGQFDTGVAAALIARALTLLIGLITAGFAVLFSLRKKLSPES